MLMKVIRWSNGDVVARDETTNKIPELSGKWDDVKDKLRREIGDHVQLLHGNFDSGATTKVKYERFFGEMN